MAGRRKNPSISNNYDLIREYLARTRAPPPIFRPTTSFMAYTQMPPHHLLVDIAYKHPQLLIDDADEVDAPNGMDSNKVNESSDITLNKNDHRQQYDSRIDASEQNVCKLIGNVNPTLIKTWEQLNGFRSEDSISPMTNYPMHYGNCELVSDSTTSNKSFIIQRMSAETASGHFYDSIDNESFITQDDGDNLIASICEEMVAGGEALAEYISIIE